MWHANFEFEELVEGMWAERNEDMENALMSTIQEVILPHIECFQACSPSCLHCSHGICLKERKKASIASLGQLMQRWDDGNKVRVLGAWQCNELEESLEQDRQHAVLGIFSHLLRGWAAVHKATFSLAL